MIRFIDLGKQIDGEEGKRKFAFFNTVDNDFILDRRGRQAWSEWRNFHDYSISYKDTYLDRFKEVSPEWIFSVQESPTTCKKIE